MAVEQISQVSSAIERLVQGVLHVNQNIIKELNQDDHVLRIQTLKGTLQKLNFDLSENENDGAQSGEDRRVDEAIKEELM